MQCKYSDFPKHNNSDGHKLAATRWYDYKKWEQVEKILWSKCKTSTIKLWCKKIVIISNQLRRLYYGQRLKISLRGHNENVEELDTSNTPANFIKILQLLFSHDKIIARKQVNTPENAKYNREDTIIHLSTRTWLEWHYSSIRFNLIFCTCPWIKIC